MTPPPFGNFPEIHPFLKRRASLRRGGDSTSGKGIEVKVKVAYIYGHHCFPGYSYMVSWMTQASKGGMADIPVLGDQWQGHCLQGQMGRRGQSNDKASDASSALLKCTVAQFNACKELKFCHPM